MFDIKVVDEKFADVIQFLTIGKVLDYYSVPQRKELVTSARNLTIIARHLCKLGIDEVLQRYVLEH